MIRAIKKLWTQYLTGKLEGVPSILAQERIIKIRGFTAVGIAALLFAFVPGELREGNVFAALVDLCVLLAAVVNLWMLSRHKDPLMASSFLLLLMILFFVYLLRFGGVAGTGALWFPTLPLIAFFLEGKERGVLWCSAFALVVLLASVFSLYSVASLFYSPKELVQILAAFATCVVIVLLFEMEIEKKNTDLVRQTETAHDFVERYREQYAVAERLRTEAVETLRDLKDTRRAMLNVLEDLETSRASAEEARLKNEIILKNIGDCVVAADEHGHVTFVNTTFESLMGWQAQDVVGKLFLEVLPLFDESGNTVSPSERPVSKLLEEDLSPSRRREISTNGYYARKDKTKIAITATATLLERDGKVVGLVQVFRDVTKAKELERMRIDFLALASHQLRTPLSGTKWLIETLLRGVLGRVSKKQKVYLEDIYRSNERMIRLVVDLLNTLRLDSDGLAFKREVVDPVRFCSDISEGVAAALKTKEVSLVCDSAGLSTRELLTSGEVLRTVVDNFVSNAINYSRPNTQIRLAVKDGTDAVEFSVTDQGIGIPKEEQAKVFERFYRASNAKTQRPDGTGLGLYMSKMLAQKIGGDVSFVSELGKGSTFTLRIPIKKG